MNHLRVIRISDSFYYKTDKLRGLPLAFYLVKTLSYHWIMFAKIFKHWSCCWTASFLRSAEPGKELVFVEKRRNRSVVYFSWSGGGCDGMTVERLGHMTCCHGSRWATIISVDLMSTKHFMLFCTFCSHSLSVGLYSDDMHSCKALNSHGLPL